MLRNGRCKLTPADVKDIVELLDANAGQIAIARLYDVTQCTISDIHRGITWTQISGRPKKKRNRPHADKSRQQ